jgi:hypothetical protein
MTDNRKAGMALMCGSLGAVATMAIHPTGSTPHLSIVSGIAHGLALLSILLLLLGTIGLSVMLNAGDRLAVTALVTYSFATVAVMLAATVSGFIMPNLLSMMARDTAAGGAPWRIVIASFFQINQAFSKLYSVGGSLAICLWSIACLRQGRPMASAIYGAVSAPLVALLILVGHLRLDIHGMAIVMLSQVVWFVLMGVWLRTQPQTE